MRIRLRGARVIDPGSIDDYLDVVMEDGLISALLEPGTPPDESNPFDIDCSGMIVVPGLIDIHVHLREPGHEYKETIRTGLLAAARGGFTAVCAMPNTLPVNDGIEMTAFMVSRARELGGSRLYPVGAITRGLKGETLCEYAGMKRAGIVALSDDGRPVERAGVMRRAMEYARGIGLPVISHAEDISLAGDGSMNEGVVATRLGLKGIPNAAESTIVMRDIALAELTGASLHIAHVSCRESVDAIRRAKKRGVPVTAETAPHYFTLTHEDVARYDTHAKMNPPLRTEQDRMAIIDALGDGTLDIIATDHAPHSSLEKDVEFDRAAFGIVGLETSLGLSLQLVRDGVMDMAALIKAMSKNPAKLLGIDNDLKPGNPADLTVIDPEAFWTVDSKLFASKGRNTPFQGYNLKGEVFMTIVQGRIAHGIPDGQG
ncbi:MAG: dihydroorotase [Desulfamplus sp.]|nr:dihydroorotase [Desulfamplus sp.]